MASFQKASLPALGAVGGVPAAAGGAFAAVACSLVAAVGMPGPAGDAPLDLSKATFGPAQEVRPATVRLRRTTERNKRIMGGWGEWGGFAVGMTSPLIFIQPVHSGKTWRPADEGQKDAP